MREGPARPAVELATLTSTNDTIIDTIDGKNVQAMRSEWRSVYLLPGGPHVIGFRLHKDLSVPWVRAIYQSDEIQVCLLAQAGHRYRTAAEIGNFIKNADAISEAGIWERAATAPHSTLHIVDIAEGDVPLSCNRAHVFPAAPPRSEPSTAAQPASPVTPPPSVPSEVASAAPEIMGLWSNEEIRPAPPTEAASAAPESMVRWTNDEFRRSKHPFLDVMGTLALDVGGQDAVRVQYTDGNTESLAAGAGGVLRAGLMVTPLWLADRIGFGAGGDVAIKFNNTSRADANVALTRYPTALTLHAFVRYAPVLYVFFAGGLEKDERISLSGSPNASATGGSSLTSRIGGTGRVGFYWTEAEHLALVFGFEYTKLSYDSPGGTVRADSGGFWMAMSWRAF